MKQNVKYINYLDKTVSRQTNYAGSTKLVPETTYPFDILIHMQ